jgi:hypothetical protein
VRVFARPAISQAAAHVMLTYLLFSPLPKRSPSLCGSSGGAIVRALGFNFRNITFVITKKGEYRTDIPHFYHCLHIAMRGEELNNYARTPRLFN